MEMIVWTYCAAIIGILIYCGIDLWSERKQISNMIGALLLIVLGVTFILMAAELWMQVVIQYVAIGGQQYIAILTEDFSKILGAIGLGTAGMAIITGGFGLISGGKYELRVSSTEPVQGVEIKR